MAIPAQSDSFEWLENASARVAIAPRLGAGIARFEIRADGEWLDVLRPAPDSPETFDDLAAYWMLPWCNRVPAGPSHFEGAEFTLDSNWRDASGLESAIHGLVCRMPWQLVERTSGQITLEVVVPARTGGWPWAFSAWVAYELTGSTLRAEVTLTNTSDRAMPVGVGLHPYFPFDPAATGGGGGREARLQVPNTGRCVAERLLATGEVDAQDPAAVELATGIEPDRETLDDCFAGVDGSVLIEWPRYRLNASMSASDPMRMVQVYTGEPGTTPAAFAVEPTSQASDALGRAHRGQRLPGELAILPGGEVFEAAVTIEARTSA